MLAPVLVSVYNRQLHLEKCINSLKLNPCSAQTDLYVVSDAAHSKELVSDVDAIRRYITSIDGFNNVFPIFRDKNLGSFLSINTAIDYVLEKHGRVIFIEDDNVVSENFLTFINDGLDFYNDDPSVFSISGYNFPVVIPKNYNFDIYKWQGFSAWGVGLWRDKWVKSEWEAEWFKAFLNDADKVKEMNSVAEHVIHFHLSAQKKNIPLITDIAISMNLVASKMYSIFPVVSKVKNIGCDGSGEHGLIAAKYANQQIDTNNPYTFVENIQPNNQINRILNRHFCLPFKAQVARSIPTPIKKLIKKLL